jgi:MFS family permease
MIGNINKRRAAWLVLALTAAVMVGNFYVYDSIGPVADLLQRQRNFSDTQIGLLNAIYNLPNVLLILVGGIFVDRFGDARMTLCTAAGIGGANLVAGWLNDGAHASARNPAGYQPMMLFFIAASALGFGFALLLWLTAGRRHHEAATY